VTPLEIPDSVDEQNLAASDTTDQHDDSNPANAQNFEIGKEVRTRSQLSSFDDTESSSGSNGTTAAGVTGAENASQSTLQQGSLTLRIGEWEYNDRFDLGDLDECRDKLKAIAPTGSFTTQDFVRDAMEVVVPDSFSSMRMQVAVRLTRFVLLLATDMLRDGPPSTVATLTPPERTLADKICRRIADDVPHLLWHGKTTCFGRVHCLMMLLEGFLRHLAIPVHSLGTEIQSNGTTSAPLRTLIATVDAFNKSRADICGTWAADNLFAAPNCRTPVSETHEIMVTPRPSDKSSQGTALQRKAPLHLGANSGLGNSSSGRSATGVHRIPDAQVGSAIDSESSSEEEELPSLSSVLQEHSTAREPLSPTAVTTDSQANCIVISDAEDEPVASIAGSCEKKQSKKRMSPRDNIAAVHYCTSCHPQDSQLPRAAGGKRCHCHFHGPKRRKIRSD
jgi:hypothetical protein